MNKREAKRRACEMVAKYIQGGLARGDFYHCCLDQEPEDWWRIKESLHELIEEMDDRADGRRKKRG